MKEIVQYVLAWTVCMFVYSFVISLTLDEVKIQEFNFREWLIFASSVGVILGTLNGVFEVFLLDKIFRRTKFVYSVISKTALFLVVFITTVVLYVLLRRHLLIPLYLVDPSSDEDLWNIFSSAEIRKHAVIAVLSNFLINFFMQIKKKMGKGVLLNLFLGKYHRPRREKRIVMFLDLISSTAIAEKLDLYKYSSFLKDFFYDIDEVINESKGAVFQFVGDEVVILWNMLEGCENNNCLRFFFQAEEKIMRESKKYLNKYGVTPEFKAGLHCGEVVITEVGATKQEIAYHGDTVNTAARIRSECSAIGKRLLVSAEVVSHLQDIDSSYTINSVGVRSFKGKQNVVALFSIQKLPL